MTLATDYTGSFNVANSGVGWNSGEAGGMDISSNGQWGIFGRPGLTIFGNNNEGTINLREWDGAMWVSRWEASTFTGNSPSASRGGNAVAVSNTGLKIYASWLNGDISQKGQIYRYTRAPGSTSGSTNLVQYQPNTLNNSLNAKWARQFCCFDHPTASSGADGGILLACHNTIAGTTVYDAYVYDWTGAAPTILHTLTKPHVQTGDWAGGICATPDGGIIFVADRNYQGSQSRVFVYDSIATGANKWAGPYQLRSVAGSFGAANGTAAYAEPKLSCTADGSTVFMGWNNNTNCRVYIFTANGSGGYIEDSNFVAPSEFNAVSSSFSIGTSDSGRLLTLYSPSKSPGVARTYRKAIYRVTGVVRDEAGVPCARTVRLYSRTSGALIGSATSSAVDGTYTITSVLNVPSTVIALDDDAGTELNALIADRVTLEQIA